MVKNTKQNIQKSNKIKSIKKSNKRKSIKKSNKRKSIKKLGGFSIKSMHDVEYMHDVFFKSQDLYKIYLKKLYGPHYAEYLEDVQIGNETEKTYRNFLLLGERHINYNNVKETCEEAYENGNICMNYYLKILSDTPICTDFFWKVIHT